MRSNLLFTKITNANKLLYSFELGTVCVLCVCLVIISMLSKSKKKKHKQTFVHIAMAIWKLNQINWFGCVTGTSIIFRPLSLRCGIEFGRVCTSVYIVLQIKCISPVFASRFPWEIDFNSLSSFFFKWILPPPFFAPVIRLGAPSLVCLCVWCTRWEYLRYQVKITY